jgi:TolB-like protein
MTRKLILAACIPAFLAAGAGASELGKKFDQTASAFVQAGKARNLEGTTLAVFPFQADEKLSKKRVDFAVGELLASQLLAKGYYKLTERAQLEDVLREQKLGLSGAVDSAAAASVGKLLGARLLVLGNVIRMGKSYQITAKLIESETSEMIASQITEVPVETFDQEAGRYLVLVPEHQAVGIFVGLGYGALGKSDIPMQSLDGGALRLTPTNASLPEGAGTFGVRYWAKPRWMVQVDFASLFSNVGGTTEDLYSAALAPTIPGKIRTGYTGFRMRASLDRTYKISTPLTWHNGVGLSFTNLDNIDMDKTEISETYPGGYSVRPDTQNTVSFFTPFVRTGVEWRPQARFGWSLFANLNILSKDYEQGVTVSKTGVADRDITLWKVSLPRLYLDSTIALYF